jgi:hypothetical protein
LLKAAVAEHKNRSNELAKLEAESEAARKDLRAIASRIYAARDLLYTVRMLKEQTQEGRHKEVWVTRLLTTGVGGDTQATSVPSRSGRRLGSSLVAPAQSKETNIDRGGLYLEGRVRFDSKKEIEDLLKYRNNYQKALEEWTTPEGGRLFKQVTWLGGVPERFKQSSSAGRANGAQTPVADGEFEYQFECVFQATSLTGEVAPALVEERRP